MLAVQQVDCELKLRRALEADPGSAAVRVRRGQDPNGVTIRSSNSIQVNGEDGAAVPGAAATVDFVCDPDATQADVYTRVAEPLVHQFVDQTLNVALIVLGAGGSGNSGRSGGGGDSGGIKYRKKCAPC